VSGGGDSVALLHLLLEAGWNPRDLYGIHINHRQRREADEEARFVEELLGKLGVPFYLKEYPGARATPAELRAYRLEVYRSMMEGLRLKGIALGHTLDDQRETRIYAFLRGSGLKGLKGMKGWDPPFWRPLLAVSRAELRGYLRERSIPYLNDPTNLDPGHPRGFIRHLLLPAIGRDAGHEALRQRILEEEDAYLDDLALKALKTLARGWYLPVDPLKGLPPPLLRRLIQRYLPFPAPYERIEAMIRAILKPASRLRFLQLPGGEEIAIGARNLVLATGIPRSPLHLDPGVSARWGYLGILKALGGGRVRILPAFLIPGEQKGSISSLPVEVRYTIPVYIGKELLWYPPYPLLEPCTSPDRVVEWNPAPPPWLSEGSSSSTNPLGE
jgi:tRNA(Ile)-lysidine synthase